MENLRYLLFCVITGSTEPLPYRGIVIGGLFFATFLVTAALLVIYSVHLARTGQMDADKKVFWAVVLVSGSVIAMPIYWYYYLWLEPRGEGGAPQADPSG
jgi:hypothetical protein